MSLDDPEPRELDVFAVRQHSDRPSGEPTRIPATTVLEARETDRAPLAVAVPGGAEVLQCPCQAVQSRRVRFFAVVRPPRGNLVLDAIPLAAQGRQRPRNLDIVAGNALIEAPLYEFEPPV